jgi:hypothetical protein
MSFPVNAAVICLARRRCDVIHAMLRNGTLNERDRSSQIKSSYMDSSSCEPPPFSTIYLTCPCQGTCSPAPAIIEPLDRTLPRVHDDNLPKASTVVFRGGAEQRDLLARIEELRHDDVTSRSQVCAGRADCDGANHLPGRLKILPPATDKAAHLVDIQVQRARLPIGKRPPDAGRTIQGNQISHQRSSLFTGSDGLIPMRMHDTLGPHSQLLWSGYRPGNFRLIDRLFT